VGSVLEDGRFPVRELVICGPGHADRRPTHHTLLFQSEARSVVVRLKSRAALQHLSPFVIKYKGLLFIKLYLISSTATLPYLRNIGYWLHVILKLTGVIKQN